MPSQCDMKMVSSISRTASGGFSPTSFSSSTSFYGDNWFVQTTTRKRLPISRIIECCLSCSPCISMFLLPYRIRRSCSSILGQMVFYFLVIAYVMLNSSLFNVVLLSLLVVDVFKLQDSWGTEDISYLLKSLHMQKVDQKE